MAAATFTVKAISALGNGEFVRGYLQKQSGSSRQFSQPYPAANGAPVANQYNHGEGAQTGSYWLYLTFDATSPDAGSNAAHMVDKGTMVVVANQAADT